MTLEADVPATPIAPPLAPASAGYRRYALALLVAIYTLNFLDRQIVNILAEPIKQELGLKDWQLGMLTGLSFALFYTTLGIPIARLAERGDRVKIISAAVAVWSYFTVVCGLAQGFTLLLLARIGVGIGEAGCTPPANSLISDITPREKRASALATYNLGNPIGTLLGLALGAVVAEAFGWRAAFLLVGAPGLLLAAVAWFTLREPRRDKSTAVGAAPPFRDALRELASKRSFPLICLGVAGLAFTGYAHVAFFGSFYLRNHAEGLAALAAAVNGALGTQFGVLAFVGLALGGIIGIAGGVGAWLGGQLVDRFGREDERAHVTVPAVGLLLAAPFAISALLAPDTGLSLLLLAPALVCSSLWFGGIYSVTQSLVRPQTRATAVAVLLLVANLIGLGCGPVALGTLSDVLAASMGEAEGLRWAMVAVAIGGVLGGLSFLAARRTVRAEVVS